MGTSAFGASTASFFRAADSTFQAWFFSFAPIQVSKFASIHEPGNLRFDILQMSEDPTRFILYEAYADEPAARAHKETAHYLAWRERVGPMMAEPRRGEVFAGLYPEAG